MVCMVSKRESFVSYSYRLVRKGCWVSMSINEARSDVKSFKRVVHEEYRNRG